MVSRFPPDTQRPPSCTSSPSSISIEIICSTKSGLPPAESAIRSRTSTDLVSPSNSAIRRSEAAASSGSSSQRRASLEFWPQSGCRSRNSGRPTQSRSIGTEAVCRAKCSTSARSVGSAHWASSSTATSGLSRASRAKSVRTAQKPSVSNPISCTASSVPLVSRSPVSWAIVSATVRASASGSSTAASFATASSAPSPSRMPAACLTIAASGQNVIPSP